MCLDLHSLMMLLIWLVVVGAIIAVVRLLLPRVLGPLGDVGTLIMAVLNIVVWAVVLIAIIIVVFELLACLLGGASFIGHR